MVYFCGLMSVPKFLKFCKLGENRFCQTNRHEESAVLCYLITHKCILKSCVLFLLGEFAELRNVTLSLVMSVRPHGKPGLPPDGL